MPTLVIEGELWMAEFTAAELASSSRNNERDCFPMPVGMSEHVRVTSSD